LAQQLLKLQHLQQRLLFKQHFLATFILAFALKVFLVTTFVLTLFDTGDNNHLMMFALPLELRLFKLQHLQQ
jgi:hypothetical protein